MENPFSLPHTPTAEESPLSQLVKPAFTTQAQHSLYLEKAFSSIKYQQIWYVKVTKKDQHRVGLIHKISTVHILFNQIIISHESQIKCCPTFLNAS